MPRSTRQRGAGEARRAHGVRGCAVVGHGAGTEVPANLAHGMCLVPAFLSSAHTAPSSVGHQSGL